MNNSWELEYKNDLTIKIVAFLLSPVLGMLYSLYRINTKSSFIILFLSFTVFGFSLVVPETETDDYNYDSVRYRAWFEEAADDNVADFKDKFVSYINFTGEHDFYSSVVYFVVSRFSDNYQMMFMVVAMILAFFMLKSLRFLVCEDNYHFSISCLCILFLFMMAQIEKVVVFRFYTAYWIAIYSMFNIFINKKKEYLALLLVTPIFHASFFILYPLLALYYFIRNSYKASVILFICSFAFSFVALSIFTSIVAFLPESLSLHYDSYVDIDYIKRINQGGSGFIWVVRLFELLLRVVVNVMILIFVRKYKDDIQSTKCELLYKFLLILMAFVNFTFMIPAVGSRFVMFAFPFIAYILLSCFYRQQYRNLIYIFAGIFMFIFLILPFSIYQIPCLKFYNDLWGLPFVFSSPIYLFFNYVL
jgi:hypothetical protein